jgi:hypothetical protein
MLVFYLLIVPFARHRARPFGPDNRTERLASSFLYSTNDWQETLGCQFTKAPLGFSFHAHT